MSNQLISIVKINSQSVHQQFIFRKLRDICIVEFIKDLAPILNNIDNLLDELVHVYTTGIEYVADQHAPLQRNLVTMRLNTQWYSNELGRAKRVQKSRKVVTASKTDCPSADIQRAVQCSQQTTHQCEETFLFCKD